MIYPSQTSMRLKFFIPTVTSLFLQEAFSSPPFLSCSHTSFSCILSMLNFIAGSYNWLTQPLLRWECDKTVRSQSCSPLFCPLFLPLWHLSLCSFLSLLKRFSDIILATILATKSDICGKKFELKIDNVRFVGHPTLLQHPPVIQVRIMKPVWDSNWPVKVVSESKWRATVI